jgi:hypothetical protein
MRLFSALWEMKISESLVETEYQYLAGPFAMGEDLDEGV